MTASAETTSAFGYEEIDAARVRLRLCRPDHANALSPNAVAELDSLIDRATAEGRRGVVLSAEGRVFSAGIDIKEAGNADDDALRGHFKALDAVLTRLRTAPFLTVACLDGPAVGAGADLALACDCRLGTTAASFRFPGIQFGVLLGTLTLVDRVGPDRAMQIVLGQQRVDATTAAEDGLLTSLHASGALVEEEGLRAAALAQTAGDTLPEFLAALRGRATESATLLDRSLRPGLANRLQVYVRRQGTR